VDRELWIYEDEFLPILNQQSTIQNGIGGHLGRGLVWSKMVAPKDGL
jgi:hypothetical protein